MPEPMPSREGGPAAFARDLLFAAAQDVMADAARVLPELAMSPTQRPRTQSGQDQHEAFWAGYAAGKRSVAAHLMAAAIEAMSEHPRARFSP